MDIGQQYLYCTKTYSNISSYITHLPRDNQERVLQVSAESLPDDGFAIEHDSILLLFIHQLHCDPLLDPSNHKSSDID